MQRLAASDLLEAGSQNKMTSAYLKRVNHERARGFFDAKFLDWCHEKGFFAENASIFGLAEGDSVDGLISDWEYCRSWPFNSWSRIWIDDKITLKYFLGDELAEVMPEYYFYSTPNGLRALCDSPLGSRQDSGALLEILRMKGELACKPNNGSLSIGFTKIEYRDGVFFLNDEPACESDILEFVLGTPNLLISEYLHPCKEFARVNPLAPTLRLVVINTEGTNPRIACGYMRFGTSRCGSANYTSADEDYNYFVDIDIDTGQYGDGRCVFHDHVEECPYHPDSGVLMEGAIPGWNKVLSAVDTTARRLFNVEYMGYDITICNDGAPKIMEINSFPQLRIPQMYRSLFRNSWVRDYFEIKIK